ncbi:MAG: toll/interleukin-1 receptor domain-containing protein [bacterium]
MKVWEALCAHCELLVDAPKEPGAHPPYYINRIEELLRRTDLFVNVLTYREPNEGDFTAADAKMRCSPYSLFEIRLAERADIPRLVLYERSTAFKPPRTQRPWEAYVPFDRGARDDLPEQAQWTKVVESKIRQWQEWTTQHRKPASYEQSTHAAILVDQEAHDALGTVLEDCVRDGGYDPAYCDPQRQRSSEALRQLREAGLVVAEFSARSRRLDQLYAAAHGLGIPAVRLLSAGDGVTLPWILDGDPGGYQHDIVRWNNLDDVPPLVKPRIAAMFRLSPALRGAKGADYLQSKRYAHLFVFISHTLKPPNRILVEKIYSKLAERHVTPFEYHQVNTAGVDWNEVLGESLRKTTHFVALLSDGYELSSTCTYELEQILERRDTVSVLPFMIGERSVPHPKLKHIHNTLLAAPDPETNADTVVEQVMKELEKSVRASHSA